MRKVLALAIAAIDAAERGSAPQITVNNTNYGTQILAGRDATVGGDVVNRDKTTNQVIE